MEGLYIGQPDRPVSNPFAPPTWAIMSPTAYHPESCDPRTSLDLQLIRPVECGDQLRYFWIFVVRKPASPCWSMDICQDRNSSTVKV